MYVTRWRPFSSLVLVPISWILLILVVIAMSLFALWGGTYMMVLPSCSDCQEMLNYSKAGCVRVRVRCACA